MKEPFLFSLNSGRAIWVARLAGGDSCIDDGNGSYGGRLLMMTVEMNI